MDINVSELKNKTAAINNHKVENRLIDDEGNIIWFKLYVLEEINDYEKYNKLVLEKLSQAIEFGRKRKEDEITITKVTDLLCIALVIRSVYKDYTESVLEIKIENAKEHEQQYIEYMDMEIYALEHYKYGVLVEYYSRMNKELLENKPSYFQQEINELKTPETLKRTRKKKFY